VSTPRCSSRRVMETLFLTTAACSAVAPRLQKESQPKLRVAAVVHSINSFHAGKRTRERTWSWPARSRRAPAKMRPFQHDPSSQQHTMVCRRSYRQSVTFALCKKSKTARDPHLDTWLTSAPCCSRRWARSTSLYDAHPCSVADP